MQILYRGKQGFSVPIASWLRGELKEYAEDILFSARARQRGYFEFAYVRRMWKQHQKGIRNFSEHLWALLI
ncbi:MAG: asparagine synthetase B, partial [Desulfobacterales bacterium]|nr:asparagine synthetase B [Desulfobacterales bacterium]